MRKVHAYRTSLAMVAEQLIQCNHFLSSDVLVSLPGHVSMDRDP